jgi:hypothetical protein
MEDSNLNNDLQKASKSLASNFMKNYFKNHGENIKVNAEKNTNDFLRILDEELNSVETKIEENKETVADNLNSPDFAKTLEQSIKISSQTDNNEKKEVLSKLITSRLFSKSESTEALIIKTACEKLENMNFIQLALLGYVYTFRTSQAYWESDTNIKTYTSEEFKNILIKRFSAYFKIPVNQIDIDHLESIGCIKLEYNIQTFLNSIIMPNQLFLNEDQQSFYKTNLGQKVLNDWDKKRLQHVILSSVSRIIAANVSKILFKKTN